VEIRKKFDEIVAFAEVERFLDTPVKRYSSGMYVRLAFAVAAHLEPEILIVDEVLAVGDAEFQKKCLGKMKDVASGGRTVLFVSHNMDAVARLCSKGILMEKGQKKFEGRIEQAVENYLARLPTIEKPGARIDLHQVPRLQGTRDAFFESVCIWVKENQTDAWPSTGKPLLFKMNIRSDRPRTVRSLAVALHTMQGLKLINADTLLLNREITLRSGDNPVSLQIDQLQLKPGSYKVGFWLANDEQEIFDQIESAFEIVVVSEGMRTASPIRYDGVVACDFDIR